MKELRERSQLRLRDVLQTPGRHLLQVSLCASPQRIWIIAAPSCRAVAPGGAHAFSCGWLCFTAWFVGQDGDHPFPQGKRYPNVLPVLQTFSLQIFNKWIYFILPLLALRYPHSPLAQDRAPSPAIRLPFGNTNSPIKGSYILPQVT